MRSYGQFCGLAKALDVIGDRWTLLIVRELLIRGACRYTDLRNGLPGIATNLLAERLRELEEAGVIEREEAPPPIATTLFRLTPRGILGLCQRLRTSSPSGARPAATAGTRKTTPSTPKYAAAMSTCGTKRRRAGFRHGRRPMTARWR